MSATTVPPRATAAAPTVSELLLPGGKPPPALARAAGAAAKREALDGALTRLTPVGLDILGSRIGRLVGEMLNVDIGSVMGSALTKSRAIADALRSTAEKPGTEAVVPLADHTLTSTYSPAVDIVVDGAAVTSIPFEVTLATEIEGGLLVINHGRIVSVRAGRAKLKASLACEGISITERQLDLDLPAVMRLPAADAQVGAVVTSGETGADAAGGVARGAAGGAPGGATGGAGDPGRVGVAGPAGDATGAAPPVGLIHKGWRWTAAGTWERAGPYRPGDIVNGHRLNATGSAWEPLPQ